MKDENEEYLIYIHIFPNGKRYIGQTKQQPEKRWLNGLGYHHNDLMKQAIKKYGWNNVEHLVVFEHLTAEGANEKERELIQKYKTNACKYGTKYGYNLTDGGDGNHGHIMSSEAKKKLSEWRKGRFCGKDSTQSKPVICDGIEYASISEFAQTFGLKREVVKSWVNGRNNMPLEWYNKNLRLKDSDLVIKPQSIPHKKQIYYDGIVYESLSELARKLGVDFREISRWMKNPSLIPKEHLDKNIHLM